MGINVEQITDLTMKAWEEVQADEQRAEQEAEELEVASDESDAEAEAEQQEGEAEDSPESGEEEADEEADAADEQSEEEDEEQQLEDEVTALFETDNPRIKAFLDKYGGDPEKALAAAAHLEQVLGRQGLQMGEQAEQIRALEGELNQLRAFGPGGNVLTPEQREWATQAIESEQPVAYVQEAMRAGEFTLARAICDGWSQDAPYEAARLAQHVDAVEQQARMMQQQQALTEQQAVPFDTNVLMEVLVENYPDMKDYEQQMVASLEALGPAHPLVQDARSQDPETAAKGIIGLYEIARAQTASVKSTRSRLKRDSRQAADDARAAAVVTSASASPKPTEAPRPREIMPGLTLEALDEAWGSR